MGSKNKKKKNKKNENNPLGVVKDTPMKITAQASNIQTLPDCEESKKLDSLSVKQDSESMTDSEKLFEKVKAKVEALKAAHNIPSNDTSASTSDNAFPLEKTIGNGQQGCLDDLPNVSQNAKVTADANPLDCNRVQKWEYIKGPEPMSNFGSNPKISKSKNVNINFVKQKKKMMKKEKKKMMNKEKKKMMKEEKKKKTADIKIQTLIEQSGNISPIVGCCPPCFHPLKESLVQKLPECENTKLESLSQKQDPISEKDLEKSLEQKTKLESLSQKQDPISNKDLEMSLEQNTKLESLSQKQDPISNKDLEKSLEQNTKPESLSQKQDPITNKDLEKSLEQNSKFESLSQKQDPISNKDLEKSLEQNTKLESLSQKQDPVLNKGLEKSPEQNTKLESLLQKQDPISEKDLGKSPEQNTKRESLSQKQDPISNKDLEKSLELVKDKTEALKAVGNTNFRNILFYNKSASTPDKAYPLEKIIEKEEWGCLGDLLNLPPGAKLTPDAYPIFVCNRVQKLEDIKDESEKSTVAGVLQYITHLIKYKDNHSTECKPGKSHKFPSIIEEKFRTIFNESSSKSLLPKNRKLLIRIVLVLTLFVDGYQTDTADIAKDLRMNVVELKKQYEQLGCEIVDDESVLLATLSVPPLLNSRSKKRKR